MKKFLLSIMKGQRKGTLAYLIVFILWPFALIYRFGVFFHRLLYHFKGVYKASRPVISIGNITIGGSGKTPIAVCVARLLQDSGFYPVILTRGYMPDGFSDSDEVSMLKEQVPLVPVLVGAKRSLSIQKNSSTSSQAVYIADDAFQHWPLARDFDIVAVNALNPFGNGHLLPAGILREPLSALKRADAFVLTKTDGALHVKDLVSRLKAINPRALIVESFYKTMGAVDVLSSKNLPGNFLHGRLVVGFCAIADPSAFKATLKTAGARVIQMLEFMDHHVYDREDIQSLLETCRKQNVDALVTTHKDAVKLRTFRDLFKNFHLVYVPVQLELTQGSDEFIQKIIDVCRH